MRSDYNRPGVKRNPHNTSVTISRTSAVKRNKVTFDENSLKQFKYNIYNFKNLYYYNINYNICSDFLF